MAARADLTGVEVDGWTVLVKAPAQNRVPFWTATHVACGVVTDLPHVALVKAQAGKGSLPACTTCVPAEERPRISHGMHLACGQSHLLGTACPDGVQREPGPNTVGRMPATTQDYPAFVGAVVRHEVSVWDQFEERLTGEELIAALTPRAPYQGHPAENTASTYVEPEPAAYLADPATGDVVIHGRVDRLEEPQAILDVIRKAMLAGNTRGKQEAIGPSQIGTPCERKLGYMLIFGAQSVSEDGEYAGDVDDLWRMQVGTILHDWLDEQFKAAGPEWLASHRIGGRAPGTIDIAELLKRLGVDFKCVAPSVLKTVASSAAKIGEKYETQIDVYGLGLIADGYPIERVALLFLPKAGTLKDAVWYSRPINPQRALDAFARRDRIKTLVDGVSAAGIGDDATARLVLPVLPTAEDYCGSCPALGLHCSGAETAWLPQGLPDSAWPAYDAAVKAAS